MAERTVPAQDAAPGLGAAPAEPAVPTPAAPTAAPTPPRTPTAPVADGPGLLRRPDPLVVNTPAEFASALGSLREQAGITVKDLARAVGTTSSTIADWFTPDGRLPPAAATATVERILAACGVPAGAARQAWVDALGRVRRLPGPPSGDDPAPYRGLASYGVDDAPFFFGRERLVARLTALVTSAASAGPTVLVGPSGSGKSSALAAGLAGRLRRDGTWDVVTLTPGAHPVESLDAALASLRRMDLAPGSRVALIVDQAEELFTLCRSEEERQAFVSRLGSPLTGGEPGPGPSVAVVVALRADFYGAALRYEPLSLALQDRQVVVGPMSTADLRRAVTEPARAVGVQLDPGLVELVVHDATALPLVSFALLETWRRGLGRLTVENYVAAGGVSGAVATAAESVYAGLPPQRRETARRLFLRLVDIGDGRDAGDGRDGPGDTVVTRRVTAAELGLGTPEGDATSEVLERFVAAGLLTTRETTVEITHDAVLTAWPRLRDWLDAERAGLVTGRRLATAALDWERDGRDPRLLLRGPALDRVREWADDPARHAVADGAARALLDASTAAQNRERAAARRRTRRGRGVLAAVSALALVTTGLSAVVLLQRNAASTDRDEALSRQLAEASRRLRRTDPTTAGQVAVLAWRTSRTAEARSALLDVSAVPLAQRLAGPGGSPAVATSTDGRVLAAAGEGGRVRIWTLGTGEDPSAGEQATVTGGDGKAFQTVAVHPEGSLVVAAGASGVLHGWDLRDPARPERLPEAPLSRGPIAGVTFSANGRTLAVATADGRVLLYDVRPGAGNATLTAIGKPLRGPARGGALQALALSADSRQLAVAAANGRVQLWTLADRARPVAVAAQPAAPGAPTSLAFSPDGRTLAAGSRDQRVYLWQLASPAAPPQRIDGAAGAVSSVAFSPDGGQLAVGGADRHVRVYETAGRTLVTDLPHSGPVTGAAYLRGGRGLATGSSDGTVRLWTTPGPAVSVPGGRVLGLGYVSSAQLVAVTGRGAPRVVDVSQPHRPRPLAAAAAAGPGAGKGAAGAAGGAVNGTATAVDRAHGIVATGGADGSVRFHRITETGVTAVGTAPSLHSGPVVAAAFGPDGTTLVTGGADGVVRLTDVTDPQHPRPLGARLETGGTLFALAVSADGRTLAVGTGSPNAVGLWDIGERERPARLGDPVTGPGRQVTSVAFAPDGHTLVAASADRAVRLLDTADRAHARWLGDPLPGTADDVTAVTVSADGRTVATAGSDGTLRLWDVRDREKPLPFASLSAAGDDALSAVAFDPAPGRIAAAGAAPAVRQWDLNPEAVAARVCAVAGGPVASSEWSRHLPGVPYRDGCRG